MKKHFHKVASFTALVLISSLASPVDVFADDEKKQKKPSALSIIDKNNSSATRELLAKKEQQVLNEASSAVFGTRQALSALARNDSKQAVSALQTVSGKLAIIREKSPSLAFIPAAVVTAVYDFQGDAKTIEATRDKVDDFLEDGNLHGARQMLAELASEVRITTTSIPRDSFPIGIKEAILLIDTGKTHEAANLLNKALVSLVETTEIIPLPILRAEALLDQASELEHKQGQSNEKSREEVLKLTDAAKDKLLLAELLGYGSQAVYQKLYAEIDIIKEALHTEKSPAIWEKITHSLAQLKNKDMNSKKWSNT